MEIDDVLRTAREARAAGATRFCMGAAWREVKDDAQFDRVLSMVRGVRDLGMEVCVTLGMLDRGQARRLKEAGLPPTTTTSTRSPEFYEQIITTRTYQDRLDTLAAVRTTGISVCCGGILGMGESVDDRCELLRTTRRPGGRTPSRCRSTCWSRVPGTPLENRPPVSPVEMVRAIATARILMPAAMVRLSAGRMQMSQEAQLLCMMAGANSLFFGEKLLTTGNPGYEADMALLEGAGLKALEPRLETAPGS